MKIFLSETKKNFVLMGMLTISTMTAFEIELLNIFYPASSLSVLVFMTYASLSVIGMFYYYQKAKKEDKLTEGL